MSPEIAIRRAEARDIPACAEKLFVFYDSIIPDKTLCPSSLRMLEILVELAQRHVFIVADLNGSIVGAIAGQIAPHQFRPDKTILSEMFWLTDPNHRSKGVGRKLLEAYLAAAERVDCVSMTLEHNTHLPDGYLERYGFRLQERIYIRVTNGDA